MKRFILLTLFVYIVPISTHADGGFVWRNQDIDIKEPEQKALILFDQGMEYLALGVKYEGAAQDFGWIVPLPSRPEMDNPSYSLFDNLSKASQDPWLGMSEVEQWLLRRAGSVADDLDVTYQRVGVYDVAILEGGSLRALKNWLSENNYFLKDNAENILAEYHSQGWVFVAMKIIPEEQDLATADLLADGEIQPISFTFATEQPIFPLRISAITGHQSEVLLYTISKEGLVPRDFPSVSWEIFCKRNYRSIIVNYDVRAKDEWNKFAEHNDMVLIKSRAVFEPEQMVDVLFEPYSAGKFLQDGGLRQRVEAATYLGFYQPPDAAEKLMDFLNSVELPVESSDDTTSPPEMRKGQDVRCALWGLGVIASKTELSPEQKNEASATALRWLSCVDDWQKIEALRSLILISPEQGTQVCLDQLNFRPVWLETFDSRFLVSMSLKQIVDFGDKNYIPPLRKMIDRYYEPRAWDSRWRSPEMPRFEMEAGQRLVIAAAACGDKEARDELVDILKQDSKIRTWRTRLKKQSQVSLGTDGYPYEIIWGFNTPNYRMSVSDIVNSIYCDLSDRPEVRDALLREVIYQPLDDSSIPLDYRALLITYLAEIKPGEKGILLKIWQQAIEYPERITLTTPIEYLAEESISVEYNPDALAASCALGLGGKVETLLSLWNKTPWTLSTEKASLAIGLVWTDSQEAVTPVLEFVKKVWGQNASTSEFLLDFTCKDDTNKGWPYSLKLDLRYRHQIIEEFLVKHGKHEVVSLVQDKSVPPVLRLYFLLNTSLVKHIPSEIKSVALRDLRSEFKEPQVLERIDKVLE